MEGLESPPGAPRSIPSAPSGCHRPSRGFPEASGSIPGPPGDLQEAPRGSRKLPRGFPEALRSLPRFPGDLSDAPRGSHRLPRSFPEAPRSLPGAEAQPSMNSGPECFVFMYKCYNRGTPRGTLDSTNGGYLGHISVYCTVY